MPYIVEFAMFSFNPGILYASTHHLYRPWVFITEWYLHLPKIVPLKSGALSVAAILFFRSSLNAQVHIVCHMVCTLYYCCCLTGYRLHSEATLPYIGICVSQSQLQSLAKFSLTQLKMAHQLYNILTSPSSSLQAEYPDSKKVIYQVVTCACLKSRGVN